MTKVKIGVVIPLILVLFGVLLITMSKDGAIVLLKGKRVELSTAILSDFHEPALFEGNSFSVQHVGTYTKGSKVTNYYMIVNISHKDWKNAFDNLDASALEYGFYVFYAVDDPERAAELDRASDESQAYIRKLMAGDYMADIPDVDVHIEGTLAKQPNSANFKSGRDRLLTNSGISQSQVADYIIVDGQPGTFELIEFFGGIALAVGGFIALIICAVISNKKAKEDEYW